MRYPTQSSLLRAHGSLAPASRVAPIPPLMASVNGMLSLSRYVRRFLNMKDMTMSSDTITGGGAAIPVPR
jgi:hypothetical protein